MYKYDTIIVLKNGAPNILLAAERDKYLCRDCGENASVVHHIDGSRKNGFKKMNNDLNNLVSLCRPCHARRHNLVNDRIDIIKLKDAGMSFKSIGDLFGISRQRAWQIYKINTMRLGKTFTPLHFQNNDA